MRTKRTELGAVLRSVYAWLASKTFYRFIIGAFVFEAAWIAFSAVYPQAFDEDFHFGIIRTYSHYWLPFLGSQPSGADAYGAVSRDPSYLYHYLMSFPYRLSTHFLHLVSEQVVALRVINIGLFAVGLVLFCTLLRRVGLSRRAANLSLLVVALIPVAPQLAGQINYDNLLFPLTAWACLLTVAVIDQLRLRRLQLSSILMVLTVCFFAVIVKYEFAPIFLAILMFLGLYGWRQLRGRFRQVAIASWRDWHATSLLRRFGPLLLLLLAFGLFLQRDGINIVRYHTFAPKCEQVISVQQCSEYAVWIHDYLSHQSVQNHSVYVNPNPLNYFLQWLYWLWYRLFFAINGPYRGFANWPPLPLPAAAFAVLFFAAIAAIIAGGWRRIRSSPYLSFLALVVVLYATILFLEGYLKYLDTGVLELMNGRYLLPIMLPAAGLALTALSPWVSKLGQAKPIIAIILIFCLLQGGGVLTFIVRSDATWDWNNRAVVDVNNAARDVLRPLIIEGPRYYTTPIWFFN